MNVRPSLAAKYHVSYSYKTIDTITVLCKYFMYPDTQKHTSVLNGKLPEVEIIFKCLGFHNKQVSLQYFLFKRKYAGWSTDLNTNAILIWLQFTHSVTVAFELKFRVICVFKYHNCSLMTCIVLNEFFHTNSM
jgi:hypothetical protein